MHVAPAEISAACPWYFEMRELIGQRPNLVPTGLGDSTTPIDDGVLMPNPSTENSVAPPVADDETDALGLKEKSSSRASSVPYEDWEPTPEPDARKRTFDDFEDEGAAADSGDDYDPSSDVISESVLPIDDPDVDVNVMEEDEGEGEVQDDSSEEVREEKPKRGKSGRKNPAKPARSKPAVPAAAAAAAQKPSKKPKIAEFADIVKDEEKTRQKELELATLRTRAQMKLTEVKGRYLEKREEHRQEEKRAKREERMMKLKLKERKMKQDHELRMQAARADPLSSTSHAASYFGNHTTAAGHSYSSGSSRYTPSEPDYTDYGILDNFTGNAVAGPSGTQDYDDLSLGGPGSSALPDGSSAFNA
ncbi:hypothetical protein K438DRAFT_569258 [Mycena galopus ATCC 62051]|nr:hypothetical protein K438DRAFT_569258 [Mycena galopus ATCC 62051]